MTEPATPAPAAAGARSPWLWRLVLVALAVAVSIAVGVTTARTENSFGPHLAEYATTTDGTVTVDLGPLGTLEVDSPLPASLGLSVTVQEIPASFTELSDSATLAALSGDLQRYVQFFSAPQATVTDVARALVIDAAQRALVVLVVLVAAWWVLRLLLGDRRRHELAEDVAPYRGRIAVGVVLALVVASVTTSSLGPRSRADDSQPVSHVFDGTALEGARVTGRLGGVIDTYGAKALAAYRTNEEFYARADASLAAAWDAQAGGQTTASGGQTQSPTAGPPASPTPTGAPAGTPTAPDATPTTSPSTAPTTSPDGDVTRTPDDEPIVAVVVTDLHCNVGMAPLITTLAERSGADLVLDAGDTTMNGTAVEQYCVSTFAAAVPDGVALVTSPGNHDSAETSRTYARAGARVLDGEVVEVDGLRILGDNDPNETRVGEGTTAGDETATEAGERLARTACAAREDGEDGVDLLLIHTPEVGEATLDAGCAPAQVSGHLHRRYGPEQVGLGIRYISSSTAGATLGQPTVGPLHGTAEMTVLRWDPASRLFVDYQVVQVGTDAAATVGPRLAWPPVVEVPTVPHLPGAPEVA